MTVLRLSSLPLAELGGVEFHYIDGSFQGGRKTVTHEYPNSDTRYVEDLGRLENIYNINAKTDDNVNNKTRDALIKVLNRSGIITLVHPRYGEKNVVCKGYTASDDITELGVTNFSITLEIASRNILPVTQKKKGFLADQKSKILGENEAAFDAGVDSVKNAKDKFDDFNATVKKAARQVNRLADQVQGIGDSFADFSTSINEIVNSSSRLVQAPSKLAASFRTAFDNLGVAYETSKQLFGVTSSFAGFDERDQVTLGNSARQKSIRNNQDQINNFINVAALATALDAAANIDYETLDELNQTREDIANSFDKLPDNINQDLLDSLNAMRRATNGVLDNIGLSVPRVINIDQVNPLPLHILVYSMYGNLDRLDQIRLLNNFVDTSQVSGSIKLLSNG